MSCLGARRNLTTSRCLDLVDQAFDCLDSLPCDEIDTSRDPDEPDLSGTSCAPILDSFEATCGGG